MVCRSKVRRKCTSARLQKNNGHYLHSRVNTRFLCAFADTGPSDYVQALADENKINCEKIGSGNWYWSFSSEAKKTAAANLSSAQATHAKQAQINEELQAKLAAAAASREDEADEMLDGGESREELSLKQASLDQQCKELMKDLACYVNDDPTELERKMEEAEKLKAAAMQWTEDIEEMEGWFKTRTEGQPDQFQELMQSFYGNEYDEENCVLRELV